jgi:type VI secretion system protein ImpL
VGIDGRSVDVFYEPGQLGLKRMIDTATKQKRDGGVFELRWNSGAITVAMGLKIISSAEAGPPQEQGLVGMRLPKTIVGAASAEKTL